MKHYGPDFEGDGTLAATGRLRILARNVSPGATSTVGLVITSAGANSFLNHNGREVAFNAAAADGGLTAISVHGAAALGTAGGTDMLTVNGPLTAVTGDVTLGATNFSTTIGGALTATAGNVEIGSTDTGSTTVINGDTTTISGTTTFTEKIEAPGGITVGVPGGTPQNLEVTGNIVVNGNSTLGDDAADIVNIGSADINLTNHANIPTAAAGTILGFDSAGNVVRLSPESFNAISKTSTSTTEALALADFVNAFNTPGTAFNGITFAVGDAINTGSLVLITNTGASRTITTVNASGAGQANVSIPQSSATADLVGATFTNNGTLYTVIAVDMESGTATVDQNLTATIAAGTALDFTLASNVEQYLFTGASTTAAAGATNDIQASELIDVSHGGDVVESLTAAGGIALTGGPVGNIFIAAQAAAANTTAGDTLPTIQVQGGVSGGIEVVGSSIRTRHIEDDAITAAKLGDDSVASINIIDGTITGTDIASATVATGNIALRAVDATLIDAATQANDSVLFLRQTTVGAVSTLAWASAGAGTVGKYSAISTITAGNSSVTITAATHGRGTAANGFIVQVQEAGTPSLVVIPDEISIATNGDTTVSFGANFAADTDFRITIQG